VFCRSLRENCDFKIANKQKRKTISILAHFHYIYGSFVQNQRFQSGVAPWDEKKKKKKKKKNKKNKKKFVHVNVEVQGEKQFFLSCP